MWIQKSKYHWAKEGWTICKYGGESEKFGLWEGNTSRGFFDSREAANIEYERLKIGYL